MPPLVLFHNPPKGAPKLPYVISRDVRFFEWLDDRQHEPPNRISFGAREMSMVLNRDGTVEITVTSRSGKWPGRFDLPARAVRVGYMHAAARDLYAHRFSSGALVRMIDNGRTARIHHVDGLPLFDWYPPGVK